MSLGETKREVTPYRSSFGRFAELRIWEYLVFFATIICEYVEIPVIEKWNYDN